MKIAFVKQDVYPDLYVCSNKTSIEDILLSTLMRIGPLSLFTLYNTDFYILKEEKAPECQVYKHSYAVPQKLRKQLKELPANQITHGIFSYLESSTNKSHKDFSVHAAQVDWSQYDIVISINISVPTTIVKKHPAVLWCYMIGEANINDAYPKYGYDVQLTQNVTGEVANTLGKVDFPYTFLDPLCLEKIGKQMFPEISERNGVYAEVNTTLERPVRSVPQLNFVKDLGHPLIFHEQVISENLKALMQSKYFVKLGGRKIRGNSVIEAISAGVLVLMNPKDVTHSQLLPKETWIHDENELKHLITELDNNFELYTTYIKKQRENIQFFIIDTPMESLINCLEEKRSGKRVSRPSVFLPLAVLLRKIYHRYLV